MERIGAVEELEMEGGSGLAVEFSCLHGHDFVDWRIEHEFVGRNVTFRSYCGRAEDQGSRIVWVWVLVCMDLRLR